jgi:hypothetical protein
MLVVGQTVSEIRFKFAQKHPEKVLGINVVVTNRHSRAQSLQIVD